MYELSVIVPVYNGGNYLEVLLDSLTQQNVKDMEVILIDDASTDNSLNIIKKYCNQFNNWKYIVNQVNKGTNVSRNIALKKSKGKYIIFCDNDDYVPKNTFKRMLENNDDYDVIMGQVRKFSTEKPNLNDYFLDKETHFYIWEDEINKFIFKDIVNDKITTVFGYPKLVCNLSLWSNMFKKELIVNYLEEVKGYPMGEGGLFVIPILFNASKIKIINEPIYYWRYNLNSLSVKEGLSKDKLLYIFKELDLINKYSSDIANSFFEMILKIILPAFVNKDDDTSNYY